jgi:putative glutamine amidotransferase
MAAPLIAITTYPGDDDGRVSLPAAYIDSVRRAGGRVLLVPPGEGDVAGLLDLVDGLVLTGGGDIDPARWGGGDHESVYQVDAPRDALEVECVELAIERALPTFAICRGMQVVNVALGGSLHMHVPDVVGETIRHRLPPREPTPHPVSVEADCEIARIIGATDIEPMSWHHQAVDRPGNGLRAVAVAPDGIIEALELDAHPWLVAVQWHPELTAGADPTQAALFDGLVRAASSTLARE